jgi:cation:H+ antiporter
MAIAHDLFLVALGFAILILAGDLLVRGAVNLSLRLGIPALIVSLTVVAFGTSAPELLVSVQALRDGVPGLALGNVVGSNIANVLLILGVPAMIVPLATGACDTRRSYVTMLAATVLFIGLGFAGTITWTQGLVLLAALGLMLWDAYRSTRRALGGDADSEVALDEAEPGMPGWKLALFLVAGIGGLPLGADILVTGAVDLAERAGVSDRVIGLTLVALGTSLPELATTLMAAIRRQAEVAMGNVIGSNLFNLLGIVGIASLFGDIPVEASFLRYDFWVMLAASLVLLPFVLLRWNIGRGWGAAMTGLYAVYVVSLL